MLIDAPSHFSFYAREAVLHTERGSLDEFFLCTGGSQWKNRAGWREEDVEAVLTGVMFNTAHGSITSLTLRGNNLEGETAAVLVCRTRVYQSIRQADVQWIRSSLIVCPRCG